MRLVLVVVFLVLGANALTPLSMPRVSTPAAVVVARRTHAPHLEAEPSPEDDNDVDATKPADATAAEGVASGYTTVYDDESPMAESAALSNSMREKLIKGQRTLGADPHSGSPFLAVFGAVGIFVILGALAVNT